MMGLKKAVIIFAKNQEVLDWRTDNAQIQASKIAYNSALDAVIDFVKRYEAGEIGQEFLRQLEKQQNEQK